MKYPLTIIILATIVLLTACDFTLAEDITPPPGFIAPTPMPTLGPLYPSSAPDIDRGAAIFTEKCAACHGERGMGDGEQGKQLPVPVAALGLPEFARSATPARWFTVVSQGNLDRFMPPFTSLSAQERWDVVAYALTLHSSSDQIEQGRSLFETRCPDCAPDFFMDQENMAALSNEDLVRVINEGTDGVPSIGSSLSEAELWSVAAYLRTLSFAPTLASAAASQAAASPAIGTPASEGTPAGTPGSTPEATSQVDITPEAAVAEGIGSVLGVVENKTGAALPADFQVTLRAFEHGADPNTGPEEIFSVEGTAQPDGSFRFDDLELVENRIFIAEATYQGVQYQSDFAVVEPGASQVALPPFTIYSTTSDYSGLGIETVHMFFDYANETSLQVFSVYTLMNNGDKTILVRVDQDQEVPFIDFPEGAEQLGYEATQDSAAFIPTADGFAMPPSDSPYGLIAFASLPREKKIQVTQPVNLSIGEFTLFLPAGVTASGAELSDEGRQTIQGTEFNIYSARTLSSGSSLDFTLSGLPKQTGAAPDLTQNQTLLIGVGALGLALILAGAWLYWRERNQAEEDPADAEEEFDTPDEIMDAIVALDDLYRAGKINEAAYRQRRDELKARLKEEL